MGTCTLDIEDNGRIWFSILSNLTLKNPIDMTGRGRGRASGPPGPPGPPPGPPGGLRQRPPAPRQPPPPVLDITQTGSTVSGSASSSASPEDISPDLSRMQLKDPVKFQGDAGKSFNVTSNYLKIVATPNTGVYEYDVR